MRLGCGPGWDRSSQGEAWLGWRTQLGCRVWGSYEVGLPWMAFAGRGVVGGSGGLWGRAVRRWRLAGRESHSTCRWQRPPMLTEPSAATVVLLGSARSRPSWQQTGAWGAGDVRVAGHSILGCGGEAGVKATSAGLV